MNTSKKAGVGAVSTLTGLTMVASMAAASVPAVAAENPAAGSSDNAQGAGGVAVEQASSTLAQSPIVKAEAIGTFTYDQTTVTPNADIFKFQGATRILCDSKDASAYANPLAWEITVTGDVSSEFTASMEELVGEDSVNQLMTCSCGGNPAGGRAIVTAGVKGIPVEYLLARAGASADANTVTFVSVDGTQVSMPIGYVIGRHGVIACEVNDEDLTASVGGSNQLWLAKTPANYFIRDVAQIVVSREDVVPPTPGEADEHPNSPNAGILAVYQG